MEYKDLGHLQFSQKRCTERAAAKKSNIIKKEVKCLAPGQEESCLEGFPEIHEVTAIKDSDMSRMQP